MMGPIASTEIDVGRHIQVHVGGLTLNIDTIASTVLALGIVLGMGFYLRARASSGVPGKLQLLWETVTSWVQEQVESNVGPVAPFVVPLAVTLFFLILVANWIELIPTAGALPSATADINFPVAMAITVVAWANIFAIIQRKGRYFAHYVSKPRVMAPMRVLEEGIKPVTLALRLWGNIFAGGIMISLIALFPAWLFWVPQAGWKLFDAAIGVIQAFIFALLTILYFGMALGSTQEEAH